MSTSTRVSVVLIGNMFFQAENFIFLSVF